jgi:hypothetical protein
MTIDTFDAQHRTATSATRGAITFLLAAALLVIGRSAGAQQPFRVADSTGESDVYPVGDAVQVYREILDLLYVDGGNRPSVIVLWDRAVPPLGWPCNWKCTELLPHQSTIDSSMILAFTRQSFKTPRIIDFGYKIPIVRVSEGDSERLEQLGFGYLAHLPPEKVGGIQAFWEGFKQKYPGAWGRLILGKVGFNYQHTEALIRVNQSCGPECRSTETVFLERAGSEWRVIERVPEPDGTTQSSGGLRYRGPRVAAGQISEIVTKRAPDARPRAETDDAVTMPVDLKRINPARLVSEAGVAENPTKWTPAVLRAIATKQQGIYSGVYTSSGRENIFSPCDVRGIGNGWAVRFNNPRDGIFLQYQFPSPGSGPPASHFIRVRGRVSVPGRFGIGFQARAIVVDSVRDI